MHAEALAFCNRYASADPVRVVEFGARDINGTARTLWPNAYWWGIDICDGQLVDEIADAAIWTGEPADLVICTEVLEHAEGWRDIVANMAANTRPGGKVLITAAGPHRQPHSAVDGGELRPGEYYANINPVVLAAELQAAGLTGIEVFDTGVDVYAAAVKPSKGKP